MSSEDIYSYFKKRPEYVPDKFDIVGGFDRPDPARDQFFRALARRAQRDHSNDNNDNNDDLIEGGNSGNSSNDDGNNSNDDGNSSNDELLKSIDDLQNLGVEIVEDDSHRFIVIGSWGGNKSRVKSASTAEPELLNMFYNIERKDRSNDIVKKLKPRKRKSRKSRKGKTRVSRLRRGGDSDSDSDSDNTDVDSVNGDNISNDSSNNIADVDHDNDDNISNNIADVDHDNYALNLVEDTVGSHNEADNTYEDILTEIGESTILDLLL